MNTYTWHLQRADYYLSDRRSDTPGNAAYLPEGWQINLAMAHIAMARELRKSSQEGTQ